MDSDNSEDRSSKSSTVASGPKVRTKYLSGKSVISVEKSEKFIGERIKLEKEKSHSIMESADSRNSNFVFVQGSSFSLSSREQGGGRRMMDYNEVNSDHDAYTSNQKVNMGDEDEASYSQGESVEESQIKKNGSPDNLDILKEAFDSFHTLQDVFKKEIQKFQELGKETLSAVDDEGESSSCIHAGHERTSEATSSRRFGSASLDSEIGNLVNNIEHLEIKLKEAKCILEVKELHIRELESAISVSELRNGGTEMGIEEIFQKTMEAEVEHIIFSGSVANLNRQIKLIEEEKTLTENQAHKMLSKLEKAKTKAENLNNQAQDLQNHCVDIAEIQEVKSLKKRLFKTTSCLLLQLGLVFMLFNFQIMPESEIVVPT